MTTDKDIVALDTLESFALSPLAADTCFEMVRDRTKPNYLVYREEQRKILFSLKDVTRNHTGFTATFTLDVGDKHQLINRGTVYLSSLSDRKRLARACHDLPLDFFIWEQAINQCFGHAVGVMEADEKAKANAIPEALYPDEILALDIPQTPWLVKDFLVDCGITILASIPKKGKTVIGLNMVKAAQDATKFLDRDIPNVPILFLALEDPWARLKRRMQTIGISGKRCAFVITCDLTQGLDPLRRLDEKYQPRIIVVDTLLAALRIKDENSPELGITVQGLADFAKERTRSLLVLHHHGKSKRDDPVLDLRGHTSLSGAVDVILGLYPEDTPGQFKLKSASRDGESLDLDLAYDGNALKWEVDTNYNEIQKIESAAAMLDLLRKDSRLTLKEIGEINGKSDTPNNNVLQRLLESGDVKRERASKEERGFAQPFVYFLAHGARG